MNTNNVSAQDFVWGHVEVEKFSRPRLRNYNVVTSIHFGTGWLDQVFWSISSEYSDLLSSLFYKHEDVQDLSVWFETNYYGSEKPLMVTGLPIFFNNKLPNRVGKNGEELQDHSVMLPKIDRGLLRVWDEIEKVKTELEKLQQQQKIVQNSNSAQ